MLSNLKSGKRHFPLFDFTTGFGAFPARLRTNDQMTVGCLRFWLIIAALLILPFGIANIFVTIRRLHDMGYSGYWYFALLAAGMFASALDKVVPVASLIVTVIVYVCLSQKSQPGLNKYDVTE